MNNAHEKPARFIEEGENVYVFIGVLDEDGETPKVVSSKYVEHAIQEDALSLINFVKYPRAASTIKNFLSYHDVNEHLLDELVGEGIILQVNTENVWTALDSFNGVRIISMAVSGNPDNEQPALIEVKRTSDGPVEAFVPLELAQLLWGAEKNMNVYRATRKISKHTGVKRQLVAHRILTNVPALLQLKLLRLEWDGGIETTVFAKFAHFFGIKS